MGACGSKTRGTDPDDVVLAVDDGVGRRARTGGGGSAHGASAAAPQMQLAPQLHDDMLNTVYFCRPQASEHTPMTRAPAMQHKERGAGSVKKTGRGGGGVCVCVHAPVIHR
jgi:hypothetical protein